MLTPLSMLRQALEPATMARCQHNLAARWQGRQVSQAKALEALLDLNELGRLHRLVLAGAIVVPEKEKETHE